MCSKLCQCIAQPTLTYCSIEYKVVRQRQSHACWREMKLRLVNGFEESILLEGWFLFDSLYKIMCVSNNTQSWYEYIYSFGYDITLLSLWRAYLQDSRFHMYYRTSNKFAVQIVFRNATHTKLIIFWNFRITVRTAARIQSSLTVGTLNH